MPVLHFSDRHSDPGKNLAKMFVCYGTSGIRVSEVCSIICSGCG